MGGPCPATPRETGAWSNCHRPYHHHEPATVEDADAAPTTATATATTTANANATTAGHGRCDVLHPP